MTKEQLIKEIESDVWNAEGIADLIMERDRLRERIAEAARLLSGHGAGPRYVAAYLRQAIGEPINLPALEPREERPPMFNELAQRADGGLETRQTEKCPTCGGGYFKAELGWQHNCLWP